MQGLMHGEQAMYAWTPSKPLQKENLNRSILTPKSYRKHLILILLIV